MGYYGLERKAKQRMLLELYRYYATGNSILDYPYKGTLFYFFDSLIRPLTVFAFTDALPFPV